MTAADKARLDAVFHALADATRRTILTELAKRDEQSLFELCVRIIDAHGQSISRQAISKHLTVLENADLIQTSWRGRTKLHSSNLAAAAPLVIDWLRRQTDFL